MESKVYVDEFSEHRKACGNAIYIYMYMYMYVHVRTQNL